MNDPKRDASNIVRVFQILIYHVKEIVKLQIVVIEKAFAENRVYLVYSCFVNIIVILPLNNPHLRVHTSFRSFWFYSVASNHLYKC